MNMDISKEVESALEEEGYVKIDSTSPSTTTTASLTSPVSSAEKTSSLSGASSLRSLPENRRTSPVQQKIRPGVSSPVEPTNPSDPSGSSSTWQRRDSDEEPFAGVWGWMSSAVSAGLQTTQNLGRNIVEKTKVSQETRSVISI